MLILTKRLIFLINFSTMNVGNPGAYRGRMSATSFFISSLRNDMRSLRALLFYDLII